MRDYESKNKRKDEKVRKKSKSMGGGGRERRREETRREEKRREGTGRLKPLLFSLGPTGAAVRTNVP